LSLLLLLLLLLLLHVHLDLRQGGQQGFISLLIPRFFSMGI
jgi:hypothetical protein